MHDLPLLVFNHGFKFQHSVCNGCHVLQLSLLKLLIIVVLFITLANLKQLIYYKILILKMVYIYIYIYVYIYIYTTYIYVYTYIYIYIYIYIMR